jgi:hypothetical protein
MSLMHRTLRLAALLLVLGWGGSAQAQYLLTGNSAGQYQIGTGLPLPVGTAGIFLGGMTPVNGGTSCAAGPGGCSVIPDGPGTAFWPPLLIPPAAKALLPQSGTWGTPAASPGAAVKTKAFINQTLGTPKGGAITIPPEVLSQPAQGTPVKIGVFPTNPAVFQVATTINYAWPAPAGTVMNGGMTTVIPGTIVLSPGGAPGPAVLGTPGAGGIMSFSGGAKAFGGPGVFAISAGPGAPGGAIPLKTQTLIGVTPTNMTVGIFTPISPPVPAVASVWINAFGALPGTASLAAVMGASAPQGVAAPGASVAAGTGTTMFGRMSPGFRAVNVTTDGPPCDLFCMGPLGTIPSSAPVGALGLSNMVTGSKGFPWTTGFVTISQPGAVPPEVFFLSGTDMRSAGVGNVSLVSGALSERALSGPNANRAWMSLTLPEPTAALGAAGALAMLGLCHGLVRRRR